MLLVAFSSSLCAGFIPALRVALRGSAAVTGLLPVLARAGGALVDLAPPPLLLSLIGALLAAVLWSAHLRKRVAEGAEEHHRELAERERAEQALRESEEKYP